MNGGDVPAHSETRLALLRRLPYFATLDEGVVRTAASLVVRRTCEAGEVVMLEGEPCAGLFIVQSGRVKILRLSLEGREQIVHFAGPGESFNEVAVFDGGPNPATVEAIEPAELLVIERSVMWDLFCRYPQLAQSVVAVLAARCRHLLALVESLSLHSVTARLAHLLLEQAARPDAPALTRAQMAARLGTVREMVSRSLKELVSEGLIRLEGARIVIVDREGLARRAGG